MRDAYETTTVGERSAPSTAHGQRSLPAWLLLLGLLLTACTGAQPADIAESEEATWESTPTAAPTTVMPAAALVVTEDYFDAYDRGDVHAMLDLFSEDVELSLFEPISTGDWWRLHTWKIAEGTELVDPSCETGSVSSSATVTLTCEYGDYNRPAQLVDGPKVPFTMEMVITPDGISRADYTFGEPDFSIVGEPFEAWMQANHPDDAAKVTCCEWASVDEAREYGELTARYAEQWAAHLEANGCAYDEPCPDGTASPS